MSTPIPERTRKAIDDYVTYGECGDFLQGVLSNDLTEAVCRPDDENLAALESIVKYVYNHTPSTCWGSREKVKAWRQARWAERVERERCLTREVFAGADVILRDEPETILGMIDEAKETSA